MAGSMKTPLGTEVDLGAGHIVLDGVPAHAKGAQHPPPSFRPMSIVATVAHLSYCWALVDLLLLLLLGFAEYLRRTFSSYFIAFLINTLTIFYESVEITLVGPVGCNSFGLLCLVCLYGLHFAYNLNALPTLKRSSLAVFVVFCWPFLWSDPFSFSLHFSWFVDNAKCTVVTRVCVSVSVCPRPRAHIIARTRM